MPHNHAGCMSPRDYFTEQLLTILVCAGVGFVGVQMYRNEMLQYILAPQFHLPVLIGSVGVLVLVVLRAAAVWKEAGELQPVGDMSCNVNHVHTAACNHPLPGMPGAAADENVADTDDHTHDMSWVFARMLILVFPVALFMMGIPNGGFSIERQRKMLGTEVALSDPQEAKRLALDPATKPEAGSEKTEPNGTVTRVLLHEKKVGESGEVKVVRLREIKPATGEPKYIILPEAGTEMRFNDLADAALDGDRRNAYSGQTAILEGRFSRIDDKQFTLFRLKMTCCGADAVMLKVRIFAPQVPSHPAGEWVRVKGVIQFVQDKDGRYNPVLTIADLTDVAPATVKNEYEF
jgi:hypothetical protein